MPQSEDSGPPKNADLNQLPESKSSEESFQIPVEPQKSEEVGDNGAMEYHETGDKHGGIPSADHDSDDVPKATETQLTQSEGS